MRLQRLPVELPATALWALDELILILDLVLLRLFLLLLPS